MDLRQPVLDGFNPTVFQTSLSEEDEARLRANFGQEEHYADEELAHLEGLREKGIITDEEFEAKKNQLSGDKSE